MTAANADAFLPVAPGTEGYAALGIAHVMVREKLTPAAAAAGGIWNAGLKEFTPEAAGKKTGEAASCFSGRVFSDVKGASEKRRELIHMR